MLNEKQIKTMRYIEDENKFLSVIAEVMKEHKIKANIKKIENLSSTKEGHKYKITLSRRENNKTKKVTLSNFTDSVYNRQHNKISSIEEMLLCYFLDMAFEDCDEYDLERELGYELKEGKKILKAVKKNTEKLDKIFGSLMDDIFSSCMIEIEDEFKKPF